jgi:hypothetical protein
MKPQPQPVERSAHLDAGRVILRDGSHLCVALEAGGEVIARRAASCLLQPEPGDRVLVGLVPEPWILAVLERDESRPAEVAFEGDAVLRSRTGRLDLRAPEVKLTAGDAVTLAARKLGLQGGAAEVVVDRLEVRGRAATACFDEVGLVARLCDRVAERVTERAARVFRFVSELDQLRAHRFDHRAEKSAQIKAEQLAIVARQVAKIDGEQVHIG